MDLRNCSQASLDPEDRFKESIEAFAEEASAQYSILDAMASKMEKLYTGLSEYFVFDKNKYSLEEFFGDIKLFIDQFKQVQQQILN